MTNAALISRARRQHGVVSTAHLLNAGLSANVVARLVREGWLRRVHQGVYVVGALESELTRPAAALLACGPAAALSHRTAAVIWGLLPYRDDTAVQVTLLNANRRHRHGVEIHNAQRLETRWRDGLKVTSPVRTLDDIATTHEFERALNEAQILRLLTHREVRETPRVRRALEDVPGFTRSEAERRVLRLIEDAGLPIPETNVRVHGHEVDMYWRSQHLVVEFDGWAYHSTRAAFERDRVRDADLLLHGERVMRITHRQIARHPDDLVARFSAALSTAGSRRMPLVN